MEISDGDGLQEPIQEYVTRVINLRRQVSRMRDIYYTGTLANDSAVYSYNCIICAISTEDNLITSDIICPGGVRARALIYRTIIVYNYNTDPSCTFNISLVHAEISLIGVAVRRYIDIYLHNNC